MASLAEWQEAVRAEYARLCGHLGLKEAGLDPGLTLRRNEDCCGHQREESAYGGPTEAHPRGLIMLPIDGPELLPLPSSYSLEMPPESAEQVRSPYQSDEGTWPEWRKCLFHEVCHQVQQDCFERDPHDGYNGHRLNWWEAVGWVGDRLDLPRKTFGVLMLPPVNPFAGGTPEAVEPPAWFLNGGPIPGFA